MKKIIIADGRATTTRYSTFVWMISFGTCTYSSLPAYVSDYSCTFYTSIDTEVYSYDYEEY